ncbi:MAG TPA: hypothetical protein VEL28_00135 [Candidatus Binatia bacterium]|nr:hypothetical protein [Candidatus Binatia bacterium]
MPDTTIRRTHPFSAATAALAVSLLLAQPVSSGAQECSGFDVRLDWSDETNPNDPWAYQEGADLLPHVDWWQRVSGGWTRAQPGWADSEDGNNRSPFWFRSNGYETFEHDYHRCDVVAHTSDDINGTGNGPATLSWTSPVGTTVSIRGAVWATREIGRSNDWALYHNQTLLTQGGIGSGDAYSRAEPFLFTAGSGGVDAVTDVDVEEGDTLSLVLTRAGSVGDLVGVKMRIACSTPPDTSTTTTTLFYLRRPTLRTGRRAPRNDHHRFRCPVRSAQCGRNHRLRHLRLRRQ